MEKFLNQEVTIITWLGGMEGSGNIFMGTIVSYDDEFVCLENKKLTTSIARKYILAIQVK